MEMECSDQRGGHARRHVTAVALLLHLLTLVTEAAYLEISSKSSSRQAVALPVLDGILRVRGFLDKAIKFEL